MNKYDNTFISYQIQPRCNFNGKTTPPGLCEHTFFFIKLIFKWKQIGEIRIKLASRKKKKHERCFVSRLDLSRPYFVTSSRHRSTSTGRVWRASVHIIIQFIITTFNRIGRRTNVFSLRLSADPADSFPPLAHPRRRRPLTIGFPLRSR